MRILGIDPGLARVGYGVIDIQDGCQRMLDCGIIQTDTGRSDGDRMVEIAGDLRQLIRIWRPELAAVEKFSSIGRATPSTWFRHAAWW